MKVQYPEVSAHYAADFDNLEVLAGFLFPETLPMVAGLRKRHEGELDFRQEAANLRECRANAEKRFKGKVVLPAVPAPHLVRMALPTSSRGLRCHSIRKARIS